MKSRSVHTAALMLLLPALAALPARPARADVLPRGVGACQIGARSYAGQQRFYDGSGDLVPYSDRYRVSLTGNDLLAGTGGTDLQTLATELARYDQPTDGADSLINRLDLGTYELDVDADVRAEYLGFAYGLTDRLTLMAALPWIDASVAASLNQTSPNNAEALRQELGGMAFAALEDGLRRAATVDADRIAQELGDSYGYAPLGHWERRGAGDLLLGGRYRARHGHRLTLLPFATASLPTGAPDDPDLLQDVAFGKGHGTLTGGLDARTRPHPAVTASLSTQLGLNAPARVRRRVPENGEALVARERTATVRLQAGPDIEIAAGVGGRAGMVGIDYRQGYRLHLRDRYDGGIDGDHDALAEGSDRREWFHEAGVTLDTTAAYRRRQVAVPLILSLSGHSPLAARNQFDNRYLQLSLTGFFATPGGR